MTDRQISQHLSSLTTSEHYNLATTHPFLRTLSVSNSASKQLLSLWLAQDRIYAAHFYPLFIGRLISRIPFSSHDTIDSHNEKTNQKILALLSFSLQNVVKEARFFLELDQKYNLGGLDRWRERSGTREYGEAMMRIASGATLEEGLVFLWAMEKVYLDAWTYVSTSRTEGHSQNEDGNGETGSAIEELIHNWTSKDFIAFVDSLAALVDGLGIQPGSEIWNKCENMWDIVVNLEIGFWPQIGEELLEESMQK